MGLLALLVFVGVIGCKGKTEQERLAEAEKQIQENNILGATILYKDFIKKFPDSPNAVWARFGLAKCYFSDRDYAKSHEVLDEIVAKAGGVDTQYGLNATMLKLDIFRQEQKLAEALDLCIKTSDSLKTVKPEFHEYFLVRMGEVFSSNGKSEEAVQLFKGLLSRTPTMPSLHMEALHGIVLVYGQAKQPEKAIDAYKEYLAAHPDADYRLKNELATMLRQANRNEEADPYFDQGEAAINKRIEETVGANEKSVAMFELATIYQLRGKKDEARGVYQKVIDDYPMGQHRPTAFMLLAESHFQDGDTSKTLAIFDQLQKTYPNTPIAVGAFRRAQEIRAKASAPPTTDTLTTASATTDAPTTAAASIPPAQAPAAPVGEPAPATAPPAQ